MSTAAMNDMQFLVNTGAIIPDSPDSATKPEATAAMASPPQPQRPRAARPLQERDPELPDYTDDFTVTDNSGQLRMTDFFHCTGSGSGTNNISGSGCGSGSNTQLKPEHLTAFMNWMN